jgi:alkanesulfonate monooxygenase SsuD/methylene tetrahydromethanopterin reductase-like flavin-dependent oxidoreductase (luciferase family)
MGFSNEEFRALGVDRETVIQIKQAFETGGMIEQVSALITDAMVDIGFIAGTPSECAKTLEEMCARAQEYGFDQILLAKLGPNYEDAITVLARDLLPAVVR